MLDGKHQEHQVYLHVMQMVPGLKECLMNGPDENVFYITELVSYLDIKRISVGAVTRQVLERILHN